MASECLPEEQILAKKGDIVCWILGTLRGSLLEEELDAVVEREFIIDEVVDADEAARCIAQQQRARMNRKWLEANWSSLLPKAMGKFLAVAGEEAFIADSPERAWELAEAAHPEDNGALVQYVLPDAGPRFYANRG